MPLYQLTDDGLKRYGEAGFAQLGLGERADLQRRLREDIGVLGEDLMVISEEFGNWEDARRRIDLLAIDPEGRLVVIELKRTDDGGHMDLQAIRYAAMVSSMTFDDVHAAYAAHVARFRADEDVDPRQELLSFLELDETDEPVISTEVRIILVSANFGREITTAVLWLNSFDGMDIRCVRLVPYEVDDKVLLDIQQVIPLPEAADYQVQVRRKEEALKRSKTSADGRDFTKYHIVVGEEQLPAVAKRHAVRQMVAALHEHGADMEKLQRALPRPKKLRCLEGRYRTPDEVAKALASVDGSVDRSRWFVESPMVVESTGKTWVLTKMWGSDTEAALVALQSAHPDAAVSFHAAD